VHHRTNLSGYIFATKVYIDNRKKIVKQQYLHTCPHNMVNFGPLAAEICWRVWGTLQISTGFASCLRQYTHVAERRSTKLCTVFVRLLGWYTIYTFLGGSCPLTEFCQVQNSLWVQVLYFNILAALLHGTRAVGVIQTLRRGTSNWITEVSLLVIFNRGRQLYSDGDHDVGHRPTF